MRYDVVIAGGGPAGLSAALALGRARKRVLLCDAGTRRNAAATQIHNFVTRDGTPPDEFRRIAREQLAHYPNVEVCDELVRDVTGDKGTFRVAIGEREIEARRILLSMGMIDVLPNIEGFHALWGQSIFQCPYCHGWEVKERPWGYLATSAAMAPFATLLRGWSRDVTMFTDGAFTLEPDTRAKLERSGVRIVTTKVARLAQRDGALLGVEVEDGARITVEVLFAHPNQRQVDLVNALGIALDQDGLVRVDPMTRETSVDGIYAGGDLTSRQQGAILAAASGVQAAAMLNHELTAELSSTESW